MIKKQINNEVKSGKIGDSMIQCSSWARPFVLDVEFKQDENLPYHYVVEHSMRIDLESYPEDNREQRHTYNKNQHFNVFQ